MFYKIPEVGGLFSSYSLEFCGQHNNVTSSTWHHLVLCSWWQSIKHNAFTVLTSIVFIGYSCIKWELDLSTTSQIQTIMDILLLKIKTSGKMLEYGPRMQSWENSGCLWENLRPEFLQNTELFLECVSAQMWQTGVGILQLSLFICLYGKCGFATWGLSLWLCLYSVDS